jgi:hypothetical protein
MQRVSVEGPCEAGWPSTDLAHALSSVFLCCLLCLQDVLPDAGSPPAAKLLRKAKSVVAALEQARQRAQAESSSPFSSSLARAALGSGDGQDDSGSSSSEAGSSPGPASLSGPDPAVQQGPRQRATVADASLLSLLLVEHLLVPVSAVQVS